jgi:hypothetical protein
MPAENARKEREKTMRKILGLIRQKSGVFEGENSYVCPQ